MLRDFFTSLMDKLKEKERCGIEADQKKPKLPPYDLKLYKNVDNAIVKEPEILSLAKEYFGEKVTIKE